MSSRDDPFDPNNWKPSRHEFRIYGDDNAQTWAVVDEEDYQWAIQWRWCWKYSRGGKRYLKRAARLSGGRGTPVSTLFLHIEIMKRTGIEQPAAHVLVDHRNGDSTDNRRRNLRWATHSMNSRNKFGSHGHELIE